MITVVAALIKKDNKYLIAKRSTGSEEVLGKWEFPGGKVEKNETEEHAIEREIKEEFEMDIKAKKYLTNNVCKYPSKIIDLRLYECEYLSGEFYLHDHSEYRFVSKEEISGFDLCPADVPLANYVKEMRNK
jgi:mutator protein MutT